MAAKLFVGNLPLAVRENELQDLFSRAGTVVCVKVEEDRITGKGRGFAFVEMSCGLEAQKAIELLNGKAFQGRNLNVDMARRRVEPRDDNGGGGKGRRGGGYRGRPEPFTRVTIK